MSRKANGGDEYVEVPMMHEESNTSVVHTRPVSMRPIVNVIVAMCYTIRAHVQVAINVFFRLGMQF